MTQPTRTSEAQRKGLLPSLRALVSKYQPYDASCSMLEGRTLPMCQELTLGVKRLLTQWAAEQTLSLEVL